MNLRHSPSLRFCIAPPLEQVALDNSHSFEYVLPSVPQTGSNRAIHAKSHLGGDTARK